MALDINRLKTTHWQAPTEVIKVPELKALFGDDEEPVVTVRGLSGPDRARIAVAAEANRNFEQLSLALLGGSNEERAKAIKEIIGLGDSLPDRAVELIKKLELGMESPKLDEESAVKLYTAFPLTAERIVRRIDALTQGGWSPGKPQPSIEGPPT